MTQTDTKDSKAKNSVQKNHPKDRGAFELIAELFLTLVFVFVTIFVSQYIIGYLMIALIGRDAFNEPVPTAIFSALYYILALVIVIFSSPKLIDLAKYLYRACRHVKKNTLSFTSKCMSRKDLGLEELPTWTDIGLSVLGYVIYVVLAGVLIYASSLFMPWLDMNQAQETGFSVGVVGFDRMVAFLVIVVVAPIAEEILFRGWLYQRLRSRLSRTTTYALSVVTSTILVSVLFGLVHGQWNVGINVFAMSLVLCALREFTGTIYAGIVLHMIKNGVAFYLLFVLMI